MRFLFRGAEPDFGAVLQVLHFFPVDESHSVLQCTGGDFDIFFLFQMEEDREASDFAVFQNNDVELICCGILADRCQRDEESGRLFLPQRRKDHLHLFSRTEHAPQGLVYDFISILDGIGNVADEDVIDVQPRVSVDAAQPVDSAEDFQILDADMKWTVEPGEFEIMAGSSSEDIRLSQTIRL